MGDPVADALMMTHQPQQPNPVPEHLNSIVNFLQGGLQGAGALSGAPQWMQSNPIQQAVQNPDNQLAMGMVSPLKGAVPENIAAAATQYRGKVYTGNVHVQSLEAAAKDHGMDISQFIDKVNKEAGKSEATNDLNGFVTSMGRFVSREEARKIADQADQLTNLAKKEGKPRLSMEELSVQERPGFGKPSVAVAGKAGITDKIRAAYKSILGH
jgi:hypothetical protein